MLVNGYLHVDTQLAGVLHDSINVFSCSPPSRLDLPVYFFSRFLFSQRYIDSVGAALALNLYTAVTNTITNEGRVAICRGALANADLRTTLDALVVPVILVASADDKLVNVAHSKGLLAVRGNAAAPDAIATVLNAPRARATVVWMDGGHEVFQTAKKAMKALVQQLATGFHEVNVVPPPAAHTLLARGRSGSTIATRAGDATVASGGVGGGGAEDRGKVRLGGGTASLEDRFIDSVKSGVAPAMTYDGGLTMTGKDGSSPKTRKTSKMSAGATMAR